MIASSLKNAEGDPIIDLLLRKGADVNVKSVTGQVTNPPIRRLSPMEFLRGARLTNAFRTRCTLQHPKGISPQSALC